MAFLRKKTVFISLLFAAVSLFIFAKKSAPTQAVFEAAPQWFAYDRFTGFQTKADATKIDDGGNANGQNTIINDGDRISIRDLGYSLFPSVSTTVASTTEARITTLHTFRKRSGEEVLMRTYLTFVEWFEPNAKINGSIVGNWEYLQTGLTSTAEFGFADNNVNIDQTSKTYFGNGIDPFASWNGAHTVTVGAVTAGATSITVADTSEFNSSGSITYCGTSQNYTSKTQTTFAVTSAVACPDGRGIAQTPDTRSELPRGSIYAFFDNRLFIAGVTSSPQVVAFSSYGSSTQWATNFQALASLVASTTYGAPGLFNLGEGGGAVTGLAQDENSMYIFKKSLIYKVSLTDTAYALTVLKPFDGKSQGIGAVNSHSIFTGGNGIFFITPDNQIMNVARLQNIDFPQVVPISDVIKPTVNPMNFVSSTGIVYRNRAFFSARSTNEFTANNTVLVWNIARQAWESPIVGWNASDWAIYDKGDGNGAQLYFGSSINPDTVQVTAVPQDDNFGVTASWRSKQYDFGAPHSLKEIDNIFVEGYIADNCTLNISFLLDDNGFTGINTTPFKGTETSYLFSSPVFNLFGLSQFGYQRFGSNQDNSGKKKFRVYLNQNLRRVPFYTAQIEFASDGSNCQWEVGRYAFSVRPSTQPIRTKLQRAFQ